MSDYDRIVISTYSIQKPSRARVDRGEQVLTSEQYHGLVLNELLDRMKISLKELNSLRFGLGINRPLWPHALIWSAEVIQNLGLMPKFTFISDHGGMSALNLIIQAYSLLKSQLLDYVLLIGADTPLTPAPLQGKWRLERTWKYELNYEMPIGMIGPISEVALIARRHFEIYGTKPEQLGIISTIFRKHSTLNPYAYLKTPLSLEEYLKSQIIAYPLRMYDTVIPVNCGYGMIITREELARKFTDELVYIKGFGTSLNSEANNELREITILHGLKDALRDALSMSNLELNKIDLLQLYDDFTIIVLMQYEDLGYVEKGKGGKFVEDNDISYQGNLPTNTGGGQLSGGQAGTAGGFFLVIEAIMQLLGKAEGRQVSGVKNSLITGLGGLGYNNNLVNKGVLILSNE